MRRAHILMVVWVLFAVVLTGCSIVQEEKNIVVDLNDVFPDYLPISSITQANVTPDENSEWLVFYHVDPTEDVSNSPTAAVIYRPVPYKDKRMPPRLVPDLLWLPGQRYLCTHACGYEIKNVITDDPEKDELVIYDKRGPDVIGAAIFQWDAELTVTGKHEAGGFVPRGHFRADGVSVKLDTVELTFRHNDRSNLATRETFKPQDGRYYVSPVTDVNDTRDEIIDFYRAEVILLPAPPKDPSRVKQPEKLIMAFYHLFGDLEALQTFFTSDGWKKIEQDGIGTACGCETEIKDVVKILVQRIAYSDQDDQETQVLIHVRCENKDEKLEKDAYFAWTVTQQPDSTWRLSKFGSTDEAGFDKAANQPTDRGGN